MERVGVTFDGSSVGAVTAARQTAVAVKEVEAAVNVTARENIVKRAEERKSLEALAAQYTLVAERAVKGSEVQVAAAELAAKAQKQLAVATVESSRASSGAFRGLGHSIAITTGAFLGAAGFVAVIKSSIDVVLAAQTGIAKLDTAITDAHASVKALTPIL